MPSDQRPVVPDLPGAAEAGQAVERGRFADEIADVFGQRRCPLQMAAGCGKVTCRGCGPGPGLEDADGVERQFGEPERVDAGEGVAGLLGPTAEGKGEGLARASSARRVSPAPGAPASTTPEQPLSMIACHSRLSSLSRPASGHLVIAGGTPGAGTPPRPPRVVAGSDGPTLRTPPEPVANVPSSPTAPCAGSSTVSPRIRSASSIFRPPHRSPASARTASRDLGGHYLGATHRSPEELTWSA